MTKGVFYFLLIFGILLCLVGISLIGYTIYEERYKTDTNMQYPSEILHRTQLIGGGVSLVIGIILIITAVAMKPRSTPSYVVPKTRVR